MRQSEDLLFVHFLLFSLIFVPNIFSQFIYPDLKTPEDWRLPHRRVWRLNQGWKRDENTILLTTVCWHSRKRSFILHDLTYEIFSDVLIIVINIYSHFYSDYSRLLMASWKFLRSEIFIRVRFRLNCDSLHNSKCAQSRFSRTGSWGHLEVMFKRSNSICKVSLAFWDNIVHTLWTIPNGTTHIIWAKWITLFSKS